MQQTTRRRVLQFATACGTVAATARFTLGQQPRRNPICVFAKHVQELPTEELARRLQEIGVQGIEATLRPGGQIEPDQLSQRLPAMCDALAKHDQQIIIAASDVNQVNAASEEYVKQLSKNSVRYLRMAYYRYDFKKPILPQLDQFAQQARELAELCGAEGVTALYQNHAGRQYVGGAVWDLNQVLRDLDPHRLAVAFDIRHASLELTQSYEAAYRMIREQIGATYVKDFAWIDDKPQNVPLGQGRARPLFELVKQDGFVGPISLHMEYTDHRDPGQTEASWQAIAADVKQLRTWLS